MAVTEMAKLLGERKDQDQIYRLTCEIDNLHAVQGRNDGLTPLTHQALAEIADTTHTEGVPTGEMAAPRARRRGRRTMKEKECQTYRFERNGDPKAIMLEVGGPYGLLAKALRDATVAINKAQYWLPTLTLISFMPTKPEFGRYLSVRAETTINALDVPKSKTPLPRMEPRNTRGNGARSMVPVFHERLVKAITVEVDMTINSECPRTPDEIAGLLHAMQGVPFGPAKRGKLKITKVERIQ